MNIKEIAAIASPAKTWILGILLHSSVSFDSTLDGIIQTAQANGYSTLVYNSFPNQMVVIILT